MKVPDVFDKGDDTDAVLAEEVWVVVVITGDREGLGFHGPFRTHDEALIWGEGLDAGYRWWTAPVFSP
jgi:hypothetical protein